ncbi:MAG: hypothetical protein ACFBWO_06245, partial [Paracoccaceae bacterium]
MMSRLPLAAALLLAGCLDAPPPGPGTARGLIAAPAPDTAETETPAAAPDAPFDAALLEADYRGPFDPRLAPLPGVFSARFRAQAGGGRTLPGVWVAHPAATTHARVRLLAPATGRAADAALVPHVAAGAPLLSSEAGAALGLSPFAPSEVLVVALAPPGGGPDYRIAAAGSQAADAAPADAPAPAEAAPGEVPPSGDAERPAGPRPREGGRPTRTEPAAEAVASLDAGGRAAPDADEPANAAAE